MPHSTFDRIAPPSKAAPCISLIGMAGVGKSTIGLALARELGWAFVDSDHIIEALYGTRLQTVTDELGKEAFLDVEDGVVSSLRLQRAVIATGGSVVYRERCMRHLQGLGPVVHLDAPLEIVEERIARNPQRGLAIAPGQSIADIFHEREPLYPRYCSLRCVTHPYTPAQCVRWILAHLDVGALSEKA